MSTIKPSKNTGNLIIVDIKPTSTNVEIFLSNNEVVTLLASNYADYYLYKNKEITSDEYLKLIEDSSNYKYLSYLYKLINYRPYSKKQLIDKLTSKYVIDSNKIDKLIDSLIEKNEYDPLIYCNEYINKLSKKGYEKSKIIKELEMQGYTIDEIESCFTNNELADIESIINDIIRKNSYKNEYQIKKSITSKLLMLGYSTSQIEKYLNDYFYNNSKMDLIKNDEVFKLRNDLEKTYNSLINKGYDDYSLKNKCINKMIQKGYKLSDIEKEYKEIKNAN